MATPGLAVQRQATRNSLQQFNAMNDLLRGELIGIFHTTKTNMVAGRAKFTLTPCAHHIACAILIGAKK